jgi:gas vesicle structural protein
MPSAAPHHVTLGSGTDSEQEVSLLEILDHVLNSGVVIQGSIVISLAGVDLVYVGLNVVLTSVETALKTLKLEESGKLNQIPRRS